MISYKPALWLIFAEGTGYHIILIDQSPPPDSSFACQLLTAKLLWSVTGLTATTSDQEARNRNCKSLQVGVKVVEIQFCSNHSSKGNNYGVLCIVWLLVVGGLCSFMFGDDCILS